MQVSVVVEEYIKEGQKDAFVAHMRELIRLTKEEEGCIAYDLYEALDDPDEVVMVEIWENKEALDNHMQTEHFQKMVPAGEIFKTAPSKVKIFGRL